MSTKNVFKGIILVVLIIIIGYQFRDVVTNPPVTGDFTGAPAEVKTTIKNSCYDCHSNETELSFYNKLPFVAEMVRKDVEKGRKKVNFSEWDKYSEKERKTILYNILTKIKKNIMPPENYLLVHPQAKISESQLVAIEAYIKGLDKDMGIKESGKDKEEFEKDYTTWINNRNKKKTVKNAPNGIEFPEDYRNWSVVSSSFRKDHNSLRVILGNDIAIKAINENRTNPWPDGTILGKVVWNQRSDENWEAAIVPSTFIHAEFMFKDSEKYKETKGWGWARWVDQELTPFGKDSKFSQSCIECHTPVKGRDYVFTTPSIFP
ncbi:cytochrome P460 family protein [Yeosuana marina]|uniref:cytochrome P460 family protein n=1 Tax=Yeosuana marina TaxID=1565536 RepID=UPI001421819C|nr:cytochrome P460 family protein [Yeosuana marina]